MCDINFILVPEIIHLSMYSHTTLPLRAYIHGDWTYNIHGEAVHLVKCPTTKIESPTVAIGDLATFIHETSNAPGWG